MAFFFLVPEQKIRDDIERKNKCDLVLGVCKPECNSWEYIFNYCEAEPCCVIREYRLP
ncbi:beta-defensin 113 [Sciurus carolinensis]|uniref:beta-defensin 113 n=1 Tax=Sciurus carolinensis TaxID=30640 RepID=UPI001FB307C4|nr:beta-defensin 113 [Sciurus carolinensis]